MLEDTLIFSTLMVYYRTATICHYFQHWSEVRANAVQTNHVQIQGDNSTLREQYRILFLCQRLAGYTFQDLINVFDGKALESNDIYVADTRNIVQNISHGA